MKQIERVLVIDDDEISIFLTKRVLKKTGIGNAILTAPNGREGLRLFKGAVEKGQPPQLVLLDIKMPVMDGFAFLEELGKLETVDLSETRIVLLSSSHNLWEMERAKKYRVVSFLHKPLEKDELLRILG
ncbi:hypothetical protein GCM10023188_07290 [Pontibacter saemangeumensis]|uniref:Response regulatory domain-containing protein n=1 Tax=Pontibacter saemangeumensis TaxID=1084525 RepID=A0ABP8LCL1_9BACT